MRCCGHVTSFVLVPLVALTIYAALEVVHPAAETAETLLSTHPEVARRFTSEFAASPDAAKPPKSSYDASSHSYNFGRYTRPILDANHHPVNPIHHAVQDKNFVWVGITQGFYHISIALLQFHYTSAAVYSVYDSHVGISWSLYRDLPFPLSKYLGPTFYPNTEGHLSAIAGCVNHTETSGRASICFDEHSKELVISVDQPLVGDTPVKRTEVLDQWDIPSVPEPMRLQLNCTVSTAGWFPTMVMPLGNNRAATVSKFAGRMTKSGRFTLSHAVYGDTRVTATLETYSLAALDYTRGLLRRETKWRWVAFSEYLHIGGHSYPYGMHLSTDTYDFGKDGAGVENSVYGETTQGAPSFRFLDQTGIKIEKVYPEAEPQRTPWRITGPNKLNLTFTPHGGRFHGSIHLYVVDAEMSHMWGHFKGTAPLPVPLYGGNSKLAGTAKDYVDITTPGVLEDHYALW